MIVNPIMVSNLTKILPLGIGLIVLSVCFYKKLPNKIVSFSANKAPKKFLINTWFFNELINRGLIWLCKPAFKMTYKLVDNQLIDSVNPSNLSNLIKSNAAYSYSFKPSLLNLLITILIWSLIISVIIL
jgi:NADH:ubiquinone oxidoreductase subunit 5 (subunit L)/multisubunit Na+/H+ antiporter MnhA subunit